MKLSIVTTLYYSAPYILEFYKHIKKTVLKITKDYEIIFINDGSPDNSLDKALSLYKKDRKVRVVDLSRNFGHHRAMMTGLAFARGDLIFLIDCDLEEKGELLEKFYSEMVNFQDIDIVYGVQSKRRGSFISKLGGAFFYRFYNFLSDYKVPQNLLTARIMTRRYLKSLLQHQDKDPWLDGLSILTGFKQKVIEVEKGNYKGRTSYTLAKRMALLLSAIISFSSRPLIYIFYLGLLIFISSVFFIIYLLIQKLLFRISVEGWVSIMVSVWFLGGLIICALGVIGLYLAKIFNEVKDRPVAIIKRVYEREKTGKNFSKN